MLHFFPHYAHLCVLLYSPVVSFPLVFPQLFASSLSCLVVVCSELDQPFLSFLLAHDMWSYLNAPDNNKSPELVIIFRWILLMSKEEVTHPLRWGFK